MYGPICTIVEKRTALEGEVERVRTAIKVVAQARKALANTKRVLDDYQALKEREVTKSLGRLRKSQRESEEVSQTAFRHKRLTREHVWTVKLARAKVYEVEKKFRSLHDPEYRGELFGRYVEAQGVLQEAERELAAAQEAYATARDELERAMQRAQQGVLAKTRNELSHYLGKDFSIGYGTVELRRTLPKFYDPAAAMAAEKQGASPEEISELKRPQPRYYVQVTFMRGQQEVRAVLDDELSELWALYIHDKAKSEGQFEEIYSESPSGLPGELLEIPKCPEEGDPEPIEVPF